MSRPPATDLNGRVAALLRELASAQTSTQKRWAYTRASDAVLTLDAPLDRYLRPDGTLQKIRHVGPSSERVILEVLRTGHSETVAQATAGTAQAAGAGRRADSQQANYLSGAQVTAALSDPTLDGPALDDYRGDLQMHSTWSDGTTSVDEMVRACRARGYTFCAITDHSYGLRIAGGASMADLRRQHVEIDALNRRTRGRFRVFKGVEANIQADGHLDLTPDEIAQFELVVASAHSALRSTEDQTGRMLRAVSTTGVHILGHPRGRKLGTRPGIRANWAKVFAHAARFGVAIEIDGDPRRQDVDFVLAREAVQAGCFIALDSDAHAPDELAFAEIAVAHARLGGIPLSRIVNCWPLDRVVEWMRLRSIATDP
ncbi:MAG: PHP domain-containing protein [Vicinamibacterales bacterium]